MTKLDRFYLTSKKPFDADTLNSLDGGDWVRYDDHLQIVNKIELELNEYKSLCSQLQEELK